MYLTILKKDLRRRKAINLIFMAFVMLATAFIGSSIQSLNAIMGGIDGYFEKAGAGDYIIGVDSGNTLRLEEFMNNSENVRSGSLSGRMLLVSKENIEIRGEEKLDYSYTLCLSRLETGGQKYYDSKKQRISRVTDGECYLPYSLMESSGLKPGDKLTVTVGGTSMELTLAGEMMDVVMGADFISMKRILLSTEDYDTLHSASLSSDIPEYNIYTLDLKDEQAFTNEFYTSGINTLFNMDDNMLKMAYIMDMIIAVVFAVVSIALIIIALIVLRFTIVFTMEQEFREIGILKALGLPDSRIRLLYLSKYVVLTLAGIITGFLLSFPLGDLMVARASRRIMLEGDSTVLFQAAGAAAVLVIVLFFGCVYTGRIRRISPVTAIRSGSDGESSGRTGVLSMRRAEAMPVPLFMALNDIFSRPKKFMMMILIFVLGIIMINIPLSAGATLRSDEMVLMMNMTRSDGAMLRENEGIMSQTRSELERELEGIEEKLGEKGIKVHTFREVMFKFIISCGDHMVSSIGVQGIGTDTDDYLYFSGTAPKLENEIAVTSLIADKLGAGIGDTVEIAIGGEKRTFIITALYESLTNMGEGVRFSEDVVLDYTEKTGAMAVQFTFSEEADKEDTGQRLKEIRDIFPEYEVMSCKEYVDDSIGGVSGILDSLSRAILIIVLAVNALIAALMVRSFIIREKGEIALLKSLGFPDRTLILWQSLRISLSLILAEVTAALLTLPLSNWIVGFVFGIVGSSEISVVLDPLMAYCVYPLTLLAVTTICGLLSALRLRKIRAREINIME